MPHALVNIHNTTLTEIPAMFMTYEKLTAAGACPEQALHFKKLFPEGVRVTSALCLKHALDFDFNWAARLLPRDKELEYNRAKASALAEYDRVIGIALAEHSNVRASAQAEYDLITTSAQFEYARVTAATFGKLAETVE